MKAEDFSWNKYEKDLYINGKWEIPSKNKVKIDNISAKRVSLEGLLYKLPQTSLAEWGFANSKPFLKFIDIGDDVLRDSIIREATQVFKNRLEGKASAYALRKAGFLAYAIKVINILYPKDMLRVDEERNRQIALAEGFLNELKID